MNEFVTGGYSAKTADTLSQRYPRLVSVPENSIIDMAKIGSQDAFGYLYEKYQGYVFTIAVSHRRPISDGDDGTRDTTQDVFVKAFTHLASFQWRGPESFKNWLKTIAINAHLDEVRGRRDIVYMDEQSGISNWEGALQTFAEVLTNRAEEVSSSLIDPKTADDLHNAVSNLSPAQRQVVELRFFKDQSVRETAEALGKTENDVRVLQHKGIARLRQILGST